MQSAGEQGDGGWGVAQNPDESKPRGDVGADEPGEFTRMFRALREEPATPGVKPAAAAGDDEFNRIFQQPQPAVPPPGSVEAVMAPPPKPMISPQPPEPARPVVAAAKAEPAAAEGFTQVFRAIQRPTSAPPQFPQPDQHASGAAAGEFTQIFSSVQAGAGGGQAGTAEQWRGAVFRGAFSWCEEGGPGGEEC